MKRPRGTKTKKAEQRPSAKPATECCEVKPYCPLVAMGASAGGLEVFQQFFSLMPPDSGMAFVLIQHLDPNHESLMPELLAKHTQMPVRKAEDNMNVEANHVYVIPPNAVLSLEACTFRLEATDLSAKRQIDRLAIDAFFRSVAEDQGETVVGVVLSGIGVDGTLGLKAIKEHGGLTIAQSIESAKFESMPRSAIATGIVDYILPVEQMPEKILDYVRHIRSLQGRKGAESVQEQAAQNLRRILPILRRKTGHDFSRYKQSTLIRRIQRRMQVMYVNTVSDYVQLLQRDLKEVDQLFKDLLIGVTQFFRDTEAFESVARHVIPQLFKERKPEQPVRVWVPGCASGEEAYSIAILLAEYAIEHDVRLNVQIFGTDLDSEALEIARKARYPDTIAEQMPAERLQRWFQPAADAMYEVVEEIREMCIFSPHNLIKDPPFSRLDLISCRNLLIYLESDLQKKLLPLFHYALNPAGFLFLGPSENVASRSELFRSVDKKHRVFQRKPTVLRSPIHVPLMDPGRVTRLQPAPPVIAATKEQNVGRIIERVILEEYSPASAIINDQGEILYFSGKTGKYLEAPAGAPTTKIINLARKGLRLELRTAVHRAITTREEVLRENVLVKVGREVQQINLVVRPLAELGKESDLFIVIFQELVPAKNAPPSDSSRLLPEIEHPVVQQLENELRTTKEDLQTTIEELETSNEELKSANEELLSMNEELQSTNEELQTSKEELQSLNDELQRKVEELDLANSDLQNLFQSTQVATVFLDSHLRIKRFTPATGQIVPLQDRDIGRHLLDAAPDLASNEIVTDIEAVLRTLTPRERQLSLGGGRAWFIMRIMPYRTLDQMVQGAVITFAEVTELKRAQEQKARLAAIVESSQDAIMGLDLDGTIRSWNAAAQRMYGYTSAEALGHPLSIIVPEDKRLELSSFLDRLRAGDVVKAYETTRIRKDGSLVAVLVTDSPVFDANARVIGLSALHRDITDRQAAEQKASELHQQLADRLAELETWFSLSPIGLAIAEDRDCSVIRANPALAALLGVPPNSNISKLSPQGSRLPYTLYRNGEELPPEEWPIPRAIRLGQTVHGDEVDFVFHDGRIVHMVVYAGPLFDRDGAVRGAMSAYVDVSARKKAETAVWDAERKFRLLTTHAPVGIFQTDRRGDCLFVNDKWCELTGQSDADARGRGWLQSVHLDDRDNLLIQWYESMESAREFSREFRLARRDGKTLWVFGTGSPLRNAEGHLVGSIGTIIDITERKNAVTALELMVEVSRLLSGPDDYAATLRRVAGIATAGLADFCVFDIMDEAQTLRRVASAAMSPEIEQRLAQPRESAAHSSVLYPDVSKTIASGRSYFLPLADAEGASAAATPGHARDFGALLITSLIIVPVVAQKGILGALTLCRTSAARFTEADLALAEELGRRAGVAIELRRHAHDLEQQVSARTASLRETADSLEGVTYTIAHDLRAPLRALQGFTRILLEEREEAFDPAAQEYARRIMNAAVRMDTLIRDLLDFARFSHVELPFSELNLSAELERILAALAQELASKNAVIDVQGPLPRVVANATVLEQVLMNLLTNALKFVTPGVAPRIRIWAEARPETVRLFIKDNGIGIAPEHQERIFGVFQRLHRADAYPGTGIGLAIVRKGIERMGGRVGLTSAIGEGTTFYLDLKAAPLP